MTRKHADLNLSHIIAKKPNELLKGMGMALPVSAPTTKDKKRLSVRVNPEAARQVRILAAERDLAIQDVLIEAINDMLLKYDRAPIA